MNINSEIQGNFETIERYLMEKTGIDLSDDFITEKSKDKEYIGNYSESPDESIDSLLESIEVITFEDNFDDTLNNAIAAVEEDGNESNPEDLLKMMKDIEYGWYSNLDDHIHGTSDDDDEEVFFANYRLQTPEETLRRKCGVCWDQVEVERQWFEDNDIDCNVFYIEIYDKQNCPTHTFLTFDMDGKFYWFEHSWGMFKGIHEYNSMNELLQDVKEKHQRFNNDSTSDVIITRIPKPTFDISCEEYMKWARNQELVDPSDDMVEESVEDGRRYGSVIFANGEFSFIRESRIFQEADEPKEEESTEEAPPSIEDEPIEEPQEEQPAEEAPAETEETPSEEPQELEDVPEELEDVPEEEPVQEETPKKEEPKSLPKQTDEAESDKNGVRRKKLYIAFIEWCKEYNSKNTFGSIFDKDAFHETYPFVPDPMRYFYRLANPMLCVLGGQLTFFPVAELRKLNSTNKQLDKLMIFAATPDDLRVFNRSDNKIYRGTEENGNITLNEVLGDTFDLYIQKMIGKGDILNAPLEEDSE